jgi:intracellular septation protein
MKIIFDFFPVLLFFLTFKWAENNKQIATDLSNQYLHSLISGGIVSNTEAPVLLATAVVILATLSQILWLKIKKRKIEPMLWVSFILVSVMGSATIYFHSESFIKWKVTILYWVMGLILWASQTFKNKNLLRQLLSEQLTLPENAWRRLNQLWILFFIFLGALNYYVAFNFSTEEWVNFKTFGLLGLMVLFTLAQAFYVSRYISKT